MNDKMLDAVIYVSVGFLIGMGMFGFDDKGRFEESNKISPQTVKIIVEVKGEGSKDVAVKKDNTKPRGCR